MAAPKGNTYWKLVNGWTDGIDKKYNPDELMQKAIDYFEWVSETPLKENVVSAGKVISIDRPRAMTIKAFCLYANIAHNTFENYSKDKAYMNITTRIRDIIYTQKFEGASVNLFNHNIIARELGLVEKSEVTNKTKAQIKVEKWLEETSERNSE